MPTLELTEQQKVVLLLVLIEYRRWPESTAEWVDVVTESKVTLDELVTLVIGAQ